MSIEELRKLLESSVITQEQFDSMVKAMGLEEPEPQPEPEPEPQSEPEPIDYDKLDKLIQSRVDKQMAAERKKNAELEKKMKRLQQEKLTDDELKRVEMDEKERAIEEREKAITEKENRLYAVRAIKEAGLDDGSDTSLALVDFVMGEDETEINEKVKAFKDMFEKKVAKEVEKEVEKRFKDNAYQPKKGGNLNGGKNPFAKEQFNVTEQMRLMVENPELAAQLEAAAKTM